MKPSIVGQISVADLLRIAGRTAPNAQGFALCVAQAENRPSMRVQPSGRGVRCHACGFKGGLFDVVIALGLAPDRAAAARFLEDRFSR